MSIFAIYAQKFFVVFFTLKLLAQTLALQCPFWRGKKILLMGHGTVVLLFSSTFQTAFAEEISTYYAQFKRVGAT